MAKEILLIGVGPDGRDSLMAQTLEQIKGCNLIIGGKRVISQFEDMDIPTYAMTANLRQLADVINSVEAAVTEGREIELPAPRRAGDERAGNDDSDGDEEGDEESSEDTPRAEGGREGGRRRGRRRPSPRNRGRRNERDGGGRDDKAAEGSNKPAEGGNNSVDTKGEATSAPASDGGGSEPGPKSVLDAGDSSQSFSIEVGKLQAPDEPEADQPEGSAAVAVDEATTAEATTADTAEAAPTEPVADTTDAPPAAIDEAAVTPEAPTDTADDATPEAAAAAVPAEAETAAKGTKNETAVARIAVLVSGDPNFYGLSKFLLERFKKEELTVVPHVSAMQLAFAAIKEPMNDAAITSSAGRNVDRLIRVVRQNAKVGIFTDKRRSPRAVAKLLCKHDVEAQCYVCQDLGTPRERIVMGTLEEIAKKNFSPLSIMILFKSVDESASGEDDSRDNRDNRDNRGNRDQRDDRSEKGGRGRSGAKLRELPEPTQAPKYELVTSLGVPDEMLAVHPENIMRSEMRVIVLSKLRLQKDSRMWDVGASCGALSVEAARVAHEGEVLAVERDFSQIRNIYENIKGFALSNVTVMEGDIETLASGLPEPDRIFIGGCGGHMHTILKLCLDRLKQGGVLVVNATTLDALTEIKQHFKEQRLKHDMVVVNISKTVERNGLEHLEGLNPGFLLTTTKD